MSYIHIWLAPIHQYKIASQNFIPSPDPDLSQVCIDFNSHGKVLGIRIDLEKWYDKLPSLQTISEFEYLNSNAGEEEIRPEHPELLRIKQNRREVEIIETLLPNLDNTLVMGGQGGNMKKQYEKHLRQQAKSLVPAKRRYVKIAPKSLQLAVQGETDIEQPMLGEPIKFEVFADATIVGIKVPLHNWGLHTPSLTKITEFLFKQPCIVPGDPVPEDPRLIALYNEEAIMDDDAERPEAEMVV